MGVGQIFEDWIVESANYFGNYCVRIKTRNSGFKGDSEIADFYLFEDGNLIYLEAKTTDGTNLPLSMIRPTQAVGIYHATYTEGILGGLLIEMRNYDEIYYLPIQELSHFMEKGNKASIGIEDLREMAIAIPIKAHKIDIPAVIEGAKTYARAID